ncbi:MAG: S9 family peptidase [Coprococcus sp.]|nr:S9 family peptidase [Coprococcus sp.]
MKEKKKNYPLCKKEEYVRQYFGRNLEDPYRWLKKAKDPEVIKWVQEENNFTDEWFEHAELENMIHELKSKKLKPLYQGIEAWKDRLTACVMEDGEPRIVSVNKQLEDERVILKKNDIPSFQPFAFQACPVNPGLAVIGGGIDGESRLTALVVDCEEKRILTEIKDIFFSCWSPTKEILYYAATETDVEAQTTATKVYGYDVKKGDKIRIYEDDKNAIIGEVHVSSDKNFVVLDMMQDYSHSRFLVYSEKTQNVTVVNEEALQMTYLDSIKGKHYFISKEGAENGEILAVEDGHGIQDAETVCAQNDKVLENGFVIGDRLYVLYMKDVCSELICVKEGKEISIELPGTMGTLGYAGKANDTAYLSFESFLDKPMMLALKGEKAETIFQTSEKKYNDIVVERKTASSKEDGKAIPYFIVHRKDIVYNGQNPTWIYAYGGYNAAMRPSSMEPIANMDIGDWAEKGGVYVLASIRGGNEFGAAWHEEGMLMKKKNCYYDFIGITEQLIKEGWTNPNQIAISGCSNGGLLMSALVTMRPDLFGCVIDSVPHTDMISFADDDRGPMYITEYGNPKESKEMFEYLLSYSPYHNVRETDYPAVYIQTGECDNNVPPYHGKKFAARMQEMNQSNNPILLRVLEKGSHDRGAGEVYWRTIAEMQLFVKKALGL